MSPLPETLVHYRTDLEEAIGREQAARLRKGRRRQRLVALVAGILVVGLLVTPTVGIGSRLLALIESAPGPREVRAPVWSSGGRQIAFLSRRGESNFDLDVVNADGSAQRRLARDATFFATLAWSPDGRKIAFEGGPDATSSVYVVNADGSGQRRLARNGRAPAWSPDGRTIAFFSDSKIYLMNADGSEHRRLTRPQSGVRDLAWSPDGRRIAFAVVPKAPGHRTGIGLWVMNADGSNPRRVARNATSSNPAWSPDGRRIAFRRFEGQVGAAGNSDLFVVNADGSGVRNLTPKPMGAASAAPAWSPDGRKLAFASDRDGNSEVYVMNANGSGQRNLTRNPAFDADPAWSPDGRTIAFVSNSDGKYGVYVMNADGSGQQRLAQRSP